MDFFLTSKMGSSTLMSSLELSPTPTSCSIAEQSRDFHNKLGRSSIRGLYITVTELYADGSTKAIQWDGLISNNAAGTYQVGEYRVCIDTKGNTQIRECYIMK